MTPLCEILKTTERFPRVYTQPDLFVRRRIKSAPGQKRESVVIKRPGFWTECIYT